VTEILSRLRTSVAIPGLSLTVLAGPDAGQRVVAEKGTLRIGASRDNDLVLTDRSVSRHHARIELRAGEMIVEDLGSTNGTRIGGVRILRAHLAPGALLEIGGTSIRVLAVEQPLQIALSASSRFGGLLGQSVEMRQVFAILERVSATDSTLLVHGETGTGKELVAEAVHGASGRAEGPFITFDASAVAPSLIESQLFGHVRGALSGATADRRGVFEEAHGGTLFLDEIGELPLELQPKLLRALESRQVTRVGETRSRPVDVRVIAATHRELASQVNRGQFREDLYFRLAVITVVVPPLSRRAEDLPILVEHFWKRFAGGEPPPASLVRDLSSRSWPGNVRELRNAVERAFVMRGLDPTVTAADGETAAGAMPGALAELGLDALFALPVDEARERLETAFFRAYLEHALARSGGSVSGAAKLIGTNRRYVQRLMRRYDLRAADDDEA